MSEPVTDVPAAVPAWQAHDLIPGRAYESLNVGLVTYVGVDEYWGDRTHAFDTKAGPRYWKTAKLGEFLKPPAAPAREEG